MAYVPLCATLAISLIAGLLAHFEGGHVAALSYRRTGHQKHDDASNDGCDTIFPVDLIIALQSLRRPFR
jgi:hypothetical protein